MAFCKCPNCSLLWELLPKDRDEAAWYAQFAPGYRVGDVVPLTCPPCFGDLHVGGKAKVHRLDGHTHGHSPEVKVGDVGTVVEVVVSPGGVRRYRVIGTGEDGWPSWDEVFERTELWRWRDKPPVKGKMRSPRRGRHPG